VAEFVIDTNVWIMIDRSIAEVESTEELDCIDASRQWLRNFITSSDHLALDNQYLILREYRKNIPQGRLAEQYLNQLEAQPRDRLIEVPIQLDENGHAILPTNITFADPGDRKFIAVAIQFTPYAPIINATDTDWGKEASILSAAGIIIEELCDAYLRSRRTNT